LAPVEHDGARCDHERRLAGTAAPPPGQQRQHLRGLAEAHVVGEAAAEAELAQEVQPAEAFPLVAAQAAREPGWLLLRRDPLEAAQTLLPFAERSIHRHGVGGMAREQQIDDPALLRAYAHGSAIDLAEGREPSPA